MPAQTTTVCPLHDPPAADLLDAVAEPALVAHGIVERRQYRRGEKNLRAVTLDPGVNKAFDRIVSTASEMKNGWIPHFKCDTEV